jgi:hypothetical protein
VIVNNSPPPATELCQENKNPQKGFKFVIDKKKLCIASNQVLSLAQYLAKKEKWAK